MRTLLKVFLGLIAAAVLAVAAVFYFTSAMVQTADRFLTELAGRDLEAAGEYLSGAFRESVDPGELEAFAGEYGLFDYQKAGWTSRSVEIGKGRISGTVTLAGGSVIPLTIDFVREDGAWKIYHLSGPEPGVSRSADRPAVPNERELVEMVRGVMAMFADAVNRDDMTAFYNECSSLWQSQTSPDELKAAFAVFMERDVDFSVLENLSPQFKSAPEVSEQGLLDIAGVYRAGDSEIHFEQNFIYEGLGWKLFGINVQIR